MIDEGDLLDMINDATSGTDSTGVVTIPVGTIHLSSPLILGDSEDLTTIRLVGAGPRYNGSGSVGTEIIADFDDREAILIQGGRNSGIFDLSIRGPYWDSKLPDYGSDRGSWPGRHLSTNPSAGIAIDRGTPYTERPTIRNVEIGGFEVGVVTKPDGGDSNGDFLTIQDSRIVGCAVAVAPTHTQGRLVAVENTTIILCHTFLDNRSYGVGLGQVNGRFTGCEFNTVHALANINTGVAQSCVFRSCHGELVGRVGTLADLGNRTTVRPRFVDCDLGFGLDPYTTLADGGGIDVEGGIWQVPDVAVFATYDTRISRTKFRVDYYESMGPPFSHGRRKGANVSVGAVGRLPAYHRGYWLSETTAWFPDPAGSDDQFGYSGFEPSRQMVSLPGVSFATGPDRLTFPNHVPAGYLGAVVQEESTLTTWIAVDVSGHTLTLDRVNNAGVTIPSDGTFHVMGA